MGLETALALGGTVGGAVMQYGENRAARKRSQGVMDRAQEITNSPLDLTQLQAMIGKTNSGQDSYLQYLRANPTGLDPFKFDTTQAFKDLAAQDALRIGDQANALSAGAGSLGQRFGSGFASKAALLRSRFAADVGARNAGIAQNSFNTALSTGLADFQSQGARQASLIQTLINAQLGQRGQQLQALGLGAGQPFPGSGQLFGQTGGDIASLLTLMKYLKKPGQNTVTPAGGAAAAAPWAPLYPND